MGFDTIFHRATADTQAHIPILLDGGLGTTLEDVFHRDINHPLWSAGLVEKDEDVIVSAHLAFLRAGSQVILASTYQAAYETFRRAGYTDSDAERLMHKSVELAVKAREIYEQELPTLPGSKENGSHVRAKVALSLGPYGAILETAAEFTGIYPVPYGPSLSAHPFTSEPRRGPVPISEEESCADALADFHFTRLLVYARAAHLWDVIDLLAFETVPLVTEAKAIRMAVARLEDWFKETTGDGKLRQTPPKMKPWYISFVFPGPQGEFPQYCTAAGPSDDSQHMSRSDGTSEKWRPYTSNEVAYSALTLKGEGQRSMATPDAIGINCTKSHLISSIVKGYVYAVRDMQRLKTTERWQDNLPWLVLYPNGGATYNPIGRTWHDTRPSTSCSQAEVKESEGARWAKTLAEIVSTQYTAHSPSWSGVFGGVLVGGCCKTGPTEIKALRETLSGPYARMVVQSGS